jgi:hypothetical protein
MWKEHIYVPINQTLRERAICWCHDEPMAGHPGIAKTLELTTRTFWWPNMKKILKNISRHVTSVKSVNLIDNLEPHHYNRTKYLRNHGPLSVSI